MNNRKTYLSALALFVSGAIFGAVCLHFTMRFYFHRFFDHGHQSMSKMILGHLDRELHLTPEQTVKLTPLIEDMSHKLHEIRKESKPRIEAILDESKQHADTILEASQREKLTQMEERVKEHFSHETE